MEHSFSSKSALCVAVASVFLTAFLTLGCLAVIPVQPAYADADANPDAVFTETVVPQARAYRVGEPIALQVKLTCTNYPETYTMYAYSTTIRVNTDIFNIDSVETKTKVDAYVSAQTGSWAGWSDVIVNFKAAQLSGTTWNSTEIPVTINVTPKALGSSSVMIRRVNVSNNTGMQSRTCTYGDTSIGVTQTKVPVSASLEDFTEASGLFEVVYDESVAAGTVPTYNGKPFCYKNGKYLYLMSEDQWSKATAADFSVVEGSPEDGDSLDVNGSQKVNIVDVQVAYDVACGSWTDTSVLSVCGWLRADVNSDGLVDATDAYALQVQIHGALESDSE